MANLFKTTGWSEGTKQTYRVYLRCYLNFCDNFNFAPVPASTEVLILYIAYLAKTKSFKFSSIRNYLTIIKHLHRANGHNDPISGNWHIEHMLLGVKRQLVDAQKPAPLMTPEMLLFLVVGVNL